MKIFFRSSLTLPTIVTELLLFLSSLDWTNPGSWAEWGEVVPCEYLIYIYFTGSGNELTKRRVDIRLP